MWSSTSSAVHRRLEPLARRLGSRLRLDDHRPLRRADVCAPIGFLLGLGAFDYWLYWISGRPTLPEDHSSHGATSWKDYFRVNTDHKVIGIQYLTTTLIFFVTGGLMAMLFRAELAEPGLQFFDSQTFNGLVSMHATLMIFLFIIPAFAGLANFVVPLMLGAPDMAFPRLNALSFWLLPIAGVMFVASFLAPGGAFATGWTGYAPLASEQPIGRSSSTWASSGRAPRRSSRRSTSWSRSSPCARRG